MYPTLELNDYQLILTDAAGTAIYTGTAAARVQRRELEFGHEALASARSHPQEFNNRYLNALSAQPLPAPLGPAKNHADLIYHHLASISTPEQPVVISIPSHQSNDQLGLLLGICNELQFPVRGFVDSALAHALECQLAGPFHVLDIEQHRLTVTAVQQTDQQLRIGDYHVWESRGVNHIVEGWMSVIADEYINRTRFDPLHSGTSEQQIYSQLLAWLASGRMANLRTTVVAQNDQRELDIAASMLSEKVHQRLSGLDLSSYPALALSHRIQAIPGMVTFVQSHCPQVTLLPDARTVIDNIQHLGHLLSDTAISRISQAPARQPSAGDSPAAAATTDDITHLLDPQHQARPVHHYAQQLADQRLAPGQQVNVNGQTLTAIKVSDE